MDEIKVFRDPLYGYIKVYDSIIWELIQTKEFQRLRRIHQLGGTSMVFHTAEHSRFSHSLGVYEIARQVITEVDDVKDTLSEEEKRITLCAALLHDLGHGPYSHAFESIFKTNHEEYTIKIILGDTEVNRVLENAQVGLAKQVARIIQKQCYQGATCEQACKHDIMVSLISSQLDVDRMDYLKRDAYNTGATYGEIDQDRILRSILVVDNQLVYKYSSLHAIENYLVSRYHMYWQVYYHPVSVSFEVILIKILERARDLVLQGVNIYVDPVIYKVFTGQITLEDHLELDETTVNYQIKRWMNEEDEILSDLSTRFINRKLFKYITCESQVELDKCYVEIKSIFENNNIDSDYYLHKDKIVKEAYQYYNEEALHNSPIMLYHRNKLYEIAEVSHIVKGIKDIGAKKDYKIYFPIEVLEHLNQVDREKLEQMINNY